MILSMSRLIGQNIKAGERLSPGGHNDHLTSDSDHISDAHCVSGLNGKM